MRVGSCFSGVGGLDLGLARAGMEHAWFCEADPFRREILRRHWPDVPIYEDVKDVGVYAPPDPSTGRNGGGRVRGAGSGGCTPQPDREQGAVDLLCGGFPCQDLSVAGKRSGLAGGRSGLFFEFARIAESVRPTWLLIENVPGLLSSNGGRDFGELLGTLADIGYGVGWRVLDSRFFGVPQRRRRVFIVGNIAGGHLGAERAGAVLSVGSGCARHLAPSGTTRPGVAAGSGASPLEPSGGGISRSLSTSNERLDADTESFIVNALDRNQGGPDDNSAQANHLIAFNHQSGQDQLQPSPDSTGSLHKGQTPAIQGEGMVRRLTPTECERLQSLPDGWTLLPDQLGDEPNPAPDGRRYAACGDAVTANVAQFIGARLMYLTESEGRPDAS